jgi:hypothetical protein
MKATTALIPLIALISSASAWTLDFWTTDGRHTSMHGRLDSGCVNIAFEPTLNINRAKFNPATDFLPDPSTFELYNDRNCAGLSYRNGGGDFRMTGRKTRSYKVY